MYVHHVRLSQQDSCETLPPKSTLSELNNTGPMVIHWVTFNYFDLFGVA